jgi:uncharacterized OB-fold protein
VSAGPPELPPVDAVTYPWWQATRERRLLIQHCAACGRYQHPPRTVCIGCGKPGPGWVQAGGDGTVDAWTTVHRAPAPGIQAPYVVARVRLAEGPLLLTNLVGEPAGGWRCGAPVAVGWRPLEDGRCLPVFRPGLGDLGCRGGVPGTSG